MLGLCFLFEVRNRTFTDRRSFYSPPEGEAGEEGRHCNGYTYLGYWRGFVIILGLY